MLYNPNDKDHKLAGDGAMEVFSQVFVVENDDSKTIVRYNVVVSAVVDFEYVVSLLAIALAFNQISKVVDSNRDVLGIARKQKSMSPREISCTAQIIMLLFYNVYPIWCGIPGRSQLELMHQQTVLDTRTSTQGADCLQLNWENILCLFTF